MINQKWRIRWLILLFLPVAYWTFYLPVFTDEVAWKWLTSRLWLDDGRSITLYPQCQEVFSISHPFLFLPSRLIESLVYGAPFSLFHLRYIGWAVFFLCGVMFWLISKSISKVRGGDPVELMLVGGGVALLGVFPFVLVMNRPEQILLLCLLLFIWLPTIKARSVIRESVLTLGFLFVSTTLFAQHAKALFFLPVVLYSGWKLKITKAKRIASVVYVLVLALQCYLFFTELTHCENSFIRETLSKMMVSPAAFVKEPIITFQQLGRNGLQGGDYLKNILIVDEYPNQWLPTNYGFHWGAAVINGLIKLFGLAWIVATLWGVLFEEQRYFLKTVVGLGIGAVGLALFQTSKNFYESALWIPVVVLMGMMTINRKTLQFFGIGLLLLATLSVSMVIYRFGSHLRNEWSGTNELTKQDYSVNASYQRAIRSRVVKLAERCGLKNEPTLQHVILDDLTYPYFMKVRQPFHAVYVLGWWGRMSIYDPELFFRSRKSFGLLSQCKWLPDALLNKVVRDQDLCCVPSF